MSTQEKPRNLTGDTYYLSGHTNSGFFRGYSIDTPQTPDDYGGLEVKGIILTHGHADHFRAAAAMKALGARVFAPREEAIMVEKPEINVRGMFSWANPPLEMVTHFFKGEACPVDALIEDGLPDGLTAISLPGHSIGHYGYLTSDNILFSGDALYSRSLWETFPLPYAIDPLQVRASLRKLAELDCRWVIPGHGEPLPGSELAEHVRYHLQRLDELDNLVLEILSQPRSTEELFSIIARKLALKETLAQYWLVVTAIKGHLSALHTQGRVRFCIQNYTVYWEAAD